MSSLLSEISEIFLSTVLAVEEKLFFDIILHVYPYLLGECFKTIKLKLNKYLRSYGPSSASIKRFCPMWKGPDFQWYIWIKHTKTLRIKFWSNIGSIRCLECSVAPHVDKLFIMNRAACHAKTSRIPVCWRPRLRPHWLTVEVAACHEVI